MSRREKVPFQITLLVRDTCLCLHTQRAARAVARRYDEALRPFGLTNGQFSLLMSLNRAEGPSVGAVATLLGMDRTTLTANLKPLERRGLVRVSVNDADKRSRSLTLTPAGHATLAAVMPVWRKTQAATERLLNGSDPDRLRGDLRALSVSG
jgi:DNA-binding MarR family transcriptional regulator